MVNENNKKLSIVYVLQVLKNDTDENHLLTQSAIAQIIETRFGMSLERKSIGASVDSLIDYGYDIIKVPHQGCYLGQRELEPSEVSFIVDSLFSSPSLDSMYCQKLVSKVSSLLSKYQRKHYHYIYKAGEINRTHNKQLFYNIEIINEAIEKGKQISFDYQKYLTKNARKRKYPHVINPYFLINNKGTYFLVCNYDYFDGIANYKLDKIVNIKILDTPIKPITNIKGFEKGFDITSYANEHIYMFSTPSIDAKILLHDEKGVGYVEEWFGNNAQIKEEEDGSLWAYIHANETSLVYWCLQYGDIVSLVSPDQTRDKIKDILKMMCTRYINDGEEKK